MLRSVRLGARIAPLLAMFVLAGPAPVVLAQSMKENLGHMLFMDKNLWLFGGICGSIDGQGRWAEADPSVGADRRSPPE